MPVCVLQGSFHVLVPAPPGSLTGALHLPTTLLDPLQVKKNTMAEKVRVDSLTNTLAPPRGASDMAKK